MLVVKKTVVKDKDLGLKELLRQLDKVDDAAVEAGIFEGESHEGTELTMAQLGAVHEFGAGNVPERSWIRRNHDENLSKYNRLLDSGYDKILQGRSRVLSVLTAVGERVASDLRLMITKVSEPPNAPSTVSRKGSSNPLIDTGSMRSSPRSRVVLGGVKLG